MPPGVFDVNNTLQRTTQKALVEILPGQLPVSCAEADLIGVDK